MTYSIRLRLPQFAHLRAVAEGVDPLAAAQRYLGPDTRHAAMSMHQALVDRARALARQSGQGAWRLIGLSLDVAGAADTAAGRGTEHAAVPTLEEWMAAQGYDGFRQSDLIDLYHAQFPPDRKRARNARLREQVLALLRDLEKLHVVAASPADRIEDWFPGTVAKRLHAAGLWLLGELQTLIGQGGRWWRAMPATGPAKAARIAHYVAGLLPDVAHLPVPWQGRAVTAAAPAPAFAEWGGSRGDGVTRAGSDAEMIETWIRKGEGPGVLEVVEDFRGDAFRAVYTVRFAGVVYVLHAFQKKSKSGIATPREEVDLVTQRLKQAQADYARRGKS